MMHLTPSNTLFGLLLILMSMTTTADELAIYIYKKDMSQTQAQEALAAGTIVAIDVRSEAEYQAGHVPGAINVPHNQIDSHLAQIKHLKDQPVLLYCRSGRRAGLAAATLSELGFSQLYHLEGDMQGWTKKQLPEEK